LSRSLRVSTAHVCFPETHCLSDIADVLRNILLPDAFGTLSHAQLMELSMAQFAALMGPEHSASNPAYSNKSLPALFMRFRLFLLAFDQIEKQVKRLAEIQRGKHIEELDELLYDRFGSAPVAADVDLLVEARREFGFQLLLPWIYSGGGGGGLAEKLSEFGCFCTYFAVESFAQDFGARDNANRLWSTNGRRPRTKHRLLKLAGTPLRTAVPSYGRPTARPAAAAADRPTADRRGARRA
jgi:hypothetical protein